MSVASRLSCRRSNQARIASTSSGGSGTTARARPAGGLRTAATSSSRKRLATSGVDSRSGVRLGVQPPPMLAEVRERPLAGIQLRGHPCACGARARRRRPRRRACVRGPSSGSCRPGASARARRRFRPCARDARRSSASRLVLRQEHADAATFGWTVGRQRSGAARAASQRATHSSNASREIRSREHSRVARNSPRRIAR
jgi:hypothetical protein